MFAFSPGDWQAMELSARVALTATVLSLPFGFAVAYLLVFSRLPGKALFDGLVNLPLVLPPVVVGYLLLLTLGSRGWLGGQLAKLGVQIVFTWKAAVIASMVVGFPLLVRSIRIGMEGIDLRLVQASRTLGARWYDTLFTRDPPPLDPGAARRGDADVRPQPRRVRRDHRHRRQHPRGDPDHSAGHLRLHQHPRRRPHGRWDSAWSRSSWRSPC